MNEAKSIGMIDKYSQCAEEKVRTVEQHLNDRITEIRHRLEKLCVAKAKAELLGILNAPLDDLARIVSG